MTNMIYLDIFSLSLNECANVIQAAPATQHRGLPGGDRLHRLPLPPHGGRPLFRQQGGLHLELVPELPVALPLRQPEARVRLRPRTGHDGHTADKLNEVIFCLRSQSEYV